MTGLTVGSRGDLRYRALHAGISERPSLAAPPTRACLAEPRFSHLLGRGRDPTSGRRERGLAGGSWPLQLERFLEEVP